jgi:3-(3-hydroxy-phenyl)propionate hydroxylase
MTELLDAVVVGYGPVGAVAAGLLGQALLRTAVFESTSSVYHLPRAAHFDAEVMRVLHELGVADDVLPACAPVEGMHFINAAGDALLRFDLEAGEGWMFYQPELESALRAGVDRSGHVAVHLEHEVTALAQCDDHVEVAVRDLATNARRTVKARYVIGADGARSAVRRELGIANEDLQLDQPWLVVDTVLRRPVVLPTRVLQICDPARPTTFIPMCGARRRWEFMLLPGEDAEAMESPPRIAELLAPWVAPDDVEIVRAVVYRFHAVLARSWRDRRVFLVGDAAHQMPPFLGQGMCSGVRDAHNLVWKLALVAAGRAPDALLDTYQQERSPHVRSIIETAVALGALLQTTDPEVASARDASMLAGPAAAPPAAMPGLTGGVITAGGGWRYRGPGTGLELIAPHDVDMPADVADWWRSIGGHLTVDGSRHDTILVRPDRYVFGSGDDAIGLLTELRSMLTPRRVILDAIGRT